MITPVADDGVNYITNVPYFAVWVGNTMKLEYDVDDIDVEEEEQFNYSASVNERIRGVTTIEWEEFQHVVRSILSAHLQEHNIKCRIELVGKKDGHRVWIPMLNNLLN